MPKHNNNIPRARILDAPSPANLVKTGSNAEIKAALYEQKRQQAALSNLQKQQVQISQDLENANAQKLAAEKLLDEHKNTTYITPDTRLEIDDEIDNLHKQQHEINKKIADSSELNSTLAELNKEADSLSNETLPNLDNKVNEKVKTQEDAEQEVISAKADLKAKTEAHQVASEERDFAVSRLNTEKKQLNSLTKKQKNAESDHKKYAKKYRNAEAEIRNLTLKNELLEKEIEKTGKIEFDVKGTLKDAYKKLKQKISEKKENVELENDLKGEKKDPRTTKEKMVAFIKQKKLQAELSYNKNRQENLVKKSKGYDIEANTASDSKILLATQIEKQKTAVGEATQEAEKKQKLVKEAKNPLIETKKNLKDKESALKSAEEEVIVAYTEYENADTKLQETTGKVNELQSDLDSLDQQRADNEKALEAAKAKKEQVLAEHTDSIRTEKNNEIKSLDTIIDDLTTTQRELDPQIKAAEKKVVKAKDHVEKLVTPKSINSPKPPNSSMTSAIASKQMNPVNSSTGWDPRSSKILEVDSQYEAHVVKKDAKTTDFDADDLAALDLMDYMVELPRNPGQKIEITGGSERAQQLMLMRATAHGLTEKDVAMDGKTPEDVKGMMAKFKNESQVPGKTTHKVFNDKDDVCKNRLENSSASNNSLGCM